ncbi:hypothetical protein ACO0QE_004241 [Hanseniaspora vineae]
MGLRRWIASNSNNNSTVSLNDLDSENNKNKSSASVGNRSHGNGVSTDYESDGGEREKSKNHSSKGKKKRSMLKGLRSSFIGGSSSSASDNGSSDDDTEMNSNVISGISKKSSHFSLFPQSKNSSQSLSTVKSDSDDTVDDGEEAEEEAESGEDNSEKRKVDRDTQSCKDNSKSDTQDKETISANESPLTKLTTNSSDATNETLINETDAAFNKETLNSTTANDVKDNGKLVSCSNTANTDSGFSNASKYGTKNGSKLKNEITKNDFEHDEEDQIFNDTSATDEQKTIKDTFLNDTFSQEKENTENATSSADSSRGTTMDNSMTMSKHSDLSSRTNSAGLWLPSDPIAVPKPKKLIQGGDEAMLNLSKIPSASAPATPTGNNSGIGAKKSGMDNTMNHHHHHHHHDTDHINHSTSHNGRVHKMMHGVAHKFAFDDSSHHNNSNSGTGKKFEISTDSEKVFGLENFGNTCYFNSMVQCLFSIDEFRIQMMTPLIPEDNHERKLYCHPLKPRYFTKQSLTKNKQKDSGASNSSGSGVNSGYKIISTDDVLAKLNTSFERIIVGRSQVDKKRHSSETRKRNALIKGPVVNIDHLSTNYHHITMSWEKDDSKIMYYCLKDLFEYIIENKYSTGVVSPIKFLNSLRIVNCMFNTSMHQDAQEFLNFLLNSISEYLDANHHSNFIKSLFQGEIVNKTKCLNCQNITFRNEPFLEFSVNISKKYKDLQSYFDNYYEKESLCGANKFHCDNCQSLQDAERVAEIGALPKILVLHEKRYKYSERENSMIKLFDKFQYSRNLKVCTTLSNSTNDSNEEPVNVCKNYELHSIVIHLGGGPSHGHYVSIVKNSSLGWLLYDDESVESIDEKDVFKFAGSHEDLSAAYVLFYKEVEAGKTDNLNDEKSRNKYYQKRVADFIKKDELMRFKIDESRKNSVSSSASMDSMATSGSIMSNASGKTNHSNGSTSSSSKSKIKRRGTKLFSGFKKNNNNSSTASIKEES